MARDKTVKVRQASPSQDPKVSLVKSSFDTKIDQFGYLVTHEEAIKCPCGTRQNGFHALSSCKNCGGTGWVFVNKTQTRMLLTSMNVDTKTKEWSEMKAGTVKVTAKTVDRISYMDRITILSGETEHTELLSLKEIDIEEGDFTRTKYATFTRYNPIEIKVIYLFLGEDQKLEILTPVTDYTVSYNRIILTEALINRLALNLSNPSNITLSLRYLHRPEFHIEDVMRDIMSSPVIDPKTKEKREDRFPIHAVARRSHYVLDEENYVGDRILINNYDNC